MKKEDFYTKFGVSRDASQDEIRDAYRRLAKKYHPDKNIGNKISEELFKEVNNIYDLLSNPVKRKNYDETLKNYDSKIFDFGLDATVNEKVNQSSFSNSVETGISSVFERLFIYGAIFLGIYLFSLLTEVFSDIGQVSKKTEIKNTTKPIPFPKSQLKIGDSTYQIGQNEKPSRYQTSPKNP